jgi:GR25 family glycosyltransferase involved in LPS biosynthesis
MAIPVVILSLTSSTKRRAEIDARLDHLGIQHCFFDAIDGRLLSTSEREALAPSSALLFDRPLTAAEIGCAASHFAAIRQLAAKNHEFVCLMEDDAVPLTSDLRFFLEPQTLRAIPRFDVLRMVSDAARWKRPAWKIAEIQGRGIYAMARPGWGLQGQVYSRRGLLKMDSQLGAISAPADFVLYHDCHIRGLRVLEIRPGLLQHDELYRDPELQRLTTIGVRPVVNRRAMSLIDRLRRNLLRQRRKSMAATNFIRVWGPRGLMHILWWWPPGAYFR